MQTLINTLNNNDTLNKANDLFGFIIGLVKQSDAHESLFKAFIEELFYTNQEAFKTLVMGNPQIFIYLLLLKEYGKKNHMHKTLNEFLNYDKQLDTKEEKETIATLLHTRLSPIETELITEKEFTILVDEKRKTILSLDIWISLSQNFDRIVNNQINLIKDPKELQGAKELLMHIIKRLQVLYQDRPYSNEMLAILNMHQIIQNFNIQQKIQNITDTKTLLEGMVNSTIHSNVIESRKNLTLAQVECSENISYANKPTTEFQNKHETLKNALEAVKNLEGFKKFWDNIKEFFKSLIGYDRVSSFKKLIITQKTKGLRRTSITN